MIVHWIEQDNSIKSFIRPISASKDNRHINKVDIEFVDNKIYLNVEINEPMSCKETILQLGITPLDIKGRTFWPSCASLGPDLIKIVYTEVSEV